MYIAVAECIRVRVLLGARSAPKKLESKVLQARSGLMRAVHSSITDPKSKGIEISENARIVCPSIFRHFISSYGSRIVS